MKLSIDLLKEITTIKLVLLDLSVSMPTCLSIVVEMNSEILSYIRSNWTFCRFSK